MKLILKNIGLLKGAELEINSLSIIAGENDNGKSTIGKIMFCLIKAVNRYKEDLEESKEAKFEEQFRRIFFAIRDNLRHISLEDSANDYLLYPLRSPNDNYEEKLKWVDNYIKILNKNDHKLIEEKNPTINSLRDKLHKIVYEPENIRESMQNALTKVFSAEFDSRILLEGETSGFIGLYNQNLPLIEIDVLEHNKIKLCEKVEPIHFKDATFIETPLILNNYDLLVRSKTALDSKKNKVDNRRLGIPYTTLHTKDLFDKLSELPFTDLFYSETNSLIEIQIKQIIQGEIVFDNKEKDFVFHKNNNRISIKNTASGIKVFGILQILAKNGFVNNNSLIIFDEPENHLHPNWQLKLAKIFAELAHLGVCILISSHSPYMIEALKRFSDQLSITEQTNFYLSENNEIQNKNKMSEIFEILSQPYDEFQKMDRDTLHE